MTKYGLDWWRMRFFWEANQALRRLNWPLSLAVLSSTPTETAPVVLSETEPDSEAGFAAAWMARRPASQRAVPFGMTGIVLVGPAAAVSLDAIGPPPLLDC